MTAQNRDTLKALFQTGDTILESSFVNLIDSMLDIVETSSQTIAGPIVFSSAVTFNDIVSAQSGIYTSSIIPTGGTTISLQGDTAATGIYSGSVINSAAARGTTRASALAVSAYITVLTLVSAGTNDGIVVGKGISGAIHHVINSTSVTAKVYSYDNVQIGSSIDGTSVVSLLPNQRMSVYTMTGTGLGSVVQYTMVGNKASV